MTRIPHRSAPNPSSIVYLPRREASRREKQRYEYRDWQDHARPAGGEATRPLKAVYWVEQGDWEAGGVASGDLLVVRYADRRMNLYLLVL